MTTEQKNGIISIIKGILSNEFGVKQKRTVLEYPDRLNFACPYCGDSDNVMKKRGNVYLSDLNFHCFNCGKHTDFFRFAKDFGVTMDIDTIELLSTVRVHKKSSRSRESFDLVLFNETEELALTRKETLRAFRLVEIPDSALARSSSSGMPPRRSSV